ncbi:sarcosine oxidase subunit alpha [Virgibacillus chiguensis]|uniref:Sarcosine oxidase subunit alpha n=2 Tax=Virgibacillus chiguensis TaxID=411959 RepID=A0A1M5QSP1_9BACI|nr:sarcosine oxidase subunit alpha [Virgibacillus chiguensis]
MRIQQGGNQMKTDLLIVGGGPAGLSAAIRGAASNIDVTLIDESFTVGGQLRQQIQQVDSLPKGYSPSRGVEILAKLEKEVLHSDVKILNNHTMVGTYENGEVGVTNGTDTFPIRAKKYLFAPGAAEEAIIFPGWTLPGVMTAGAVQILLHRELVLPGEEALIVGSNDFALETAQQLIECGINIKGIVEKGDKVISENVGLLSYLNTYQIPIYLQSEIEMVTGKGEIESVIVQTNETQLKMKVDLICTASTFSPIVETFQLMNCHLIYKHELGGWIPIYNQGFQTTNDSVYVAGNAAGVTHLGAILLTGEIAAVHALATMGKISNVDDVLDELWEALSSLEQAENMQRRYENIQAYYKLKGLPLPKI